MRKMIHIFAIAFWLISIAISVSAQTMYPIDWVDKVNVTVNANNSLTRGSGTGWNAGAASGNVLPPNVNGHCRFVVTSLTGSYMVGLSRNNLDANFTSIHFALYQNGADLAVRESGTAVASFGTISIGDTLMVKLHGDSIKYYRNNSLLRKVKAGLSSYSYTVDVSINSGSIPVVQASFDTGINLMATITPVDGPTANGSATLTPRGGKSPYSYLWNTLETSASITNKSVGNYQVTVTDSDGRTATKEVVIGRKSYWTAITPNLTLNGSNRFVKSGTNSWDAGAATSNIIPCGTSGWVDAIHEEGAHLYTVGLSRRNVDQTEEFIEHAFRISSNLVYIFENTAEIGLFGNAVRGDVFRVALENDSIKYLWNGKLIRKLKAASCAANGSYIADISTSTNGATSPFIQCSNDATIIPNTAITGANVSGTDGAITITAAGGQPPYTYSWSSGEMGNSIAGKTVGNYSVTITDALGRTKITEISLGYAIDWTDVGAKARILSDNSIQKYPQNNWEGAASNNVLLPNTDGWIEFIIDRVDANNFRVGLSQANADGLQTNIGYGYTVYTNGTLSIHELNVAQGELRAIRPAEKYRIAREGGLIKYFRDGELLRSVSVSASTRLLVDVSVYEGRIPVMTSSFESRPVMFGVIQPIDASGQNGGVNVTVKGGAAPYSIVWSTGETGAVLSGKSIGTYTATLTDAGGKTATQTFSVGHAIQWYLTTNVSRQPGYALVKSGTTNWDGGAFSSNQIPGGQDGWIEFIVTNLGSLYEIGLSSINTNVLPTSIQHGIKVDVNGLATVHQQSSTISHSFGIINKGDVFRISKVGTEIRYYRNGAQAPFTATVNGATPLYADVSIHTLSYIPPIFGSMNHTPLQGQSAILSNFAFLYKYDARKRMTEKKFPGSDWIYMVYDDRDRLVLTQDGNQRSTNEWIYTKYDALNRPVMTGIYKHIGSETTRASMQAYVNTLYTSVDKFYEEYNGVALSHGYSNRTFPTTSTTLLSVTYYDNYSFKTLFNDPRFDYVEDHVENQAEMFSRLHGQQTGSKTLAMGYNSWMRSVNYFDDRQRPIQKVEETHHGTINRLTSVYDFTGKVLTTKSTENESYSLVWKAMRNVSLVGEKVTSINNSVTWNSGASSLQVLPASQDGWIEMPIEDVAHIRMLGFNNSDPDADYINIDYAAYASGTVLYAYDGSSKFAAQLQKGDIVRIERIAGKVFLKHNGHVVYSFPTTSTAALLADLAFYSTGHSINNARASFGVDKSEATTLKWIYGNNVSVNASGVASKSGGGDAWNGFAGTMNVLSGKGWMQFVAGQTNTAKMLGLSPVTPMANWNQLEYGIYLKSNGKYDIRQRDTIVHDMNESYTTTDVFKIETDSASVRFYKNGTLKFESTKAPTKSYRAQVAMFHQPGTVGPISVSFPIPLSENKTDILNELKYDHAGRLTETWQAINNDQKILLVANEYNELGQLIDKKLYSTATPSTPEASRAYKQSVDYNYNIRGWLTNINDAALSIADPSNYGKDLFGMNLVYEQLVPNVTALADRQFNGNISSIAWSTNLGLGDTTQLGYRFGYDPMNRLLSADHLVKDDTWSPGTYHEKNLSYDLNGNILSLKRGNKETATMDELAYDYGTGTSLSNRLLKVGDGGDDDKGFKDAMNTSLDYAYDFNGNMISDLNKDITSIKYNHLNLPERVTKSDGQYIRYYYDATGRKLNQSVYNKSNLVVKRSDYIASLFIENDTTKFVNHAEGRYIPAATSSQFGEYQYHMKDHLGNVRLTFTTKDDIETSIATMESANIVSERSQYLNHEEAIIVSSTLFDHTYDGTTGATYNATMLRGGTNETYGLARSLSVMPGDSIKMEVYAKYIDPQSSNWDGAFESFLTSFKSPTPPAGSIIDGGLTGSLGNAVFPYINLLPRDEVDETAPKAYLNWIVFDRNFKPLIGESGYIQISTGAKESGSNISHELLKRPTALRISEPGYVYIYLSNENETPIDVIFDDFKVEHIKSPVVQTDDYYPFGLTFNSYKRDISLFNRIKFQGQENISDLGLNWDSFKWRNHQPEIGRFFNVDPLAEKYLYNSCYAFSENKVIAHIELEGLEAQAIKNVKNGFKGVSKKLTDKSTYSEIGKGFQELAEKFSELIPALPQVNVVGDGPSEDSRPLPRPAPKKKMLFVDAGFLDQLDLGLGQKKLKKGKPSKDSPSGKTDETTIKDVAQDTNESSKDDTTKDNIKDVEQVVNDGDELTSVKINDPKVIGNTKNYNYIQGKSVKTGKDTVIQQSNNQ